MKTIFWFWLFLGSCFVLQGQSLHEDYLTLNLLKPIDPFYPRINAGYVLDLNNGFGLGANIGFGHESWAPFKPEEEPKINYRFREVNIEFIKFSERSKNLTEYLALELFYLKHTETRINQNYMPDSQRRLDFDSAEYERTKFGLNAKAGIFFSLTKTFGVNCYAGLGVRIRENEFSDLVNVREDNDFEEEFLLILSDPVTKAYQQEGTRVGLNVTVGANIFLKLRKPLPGLSD